MSLAEPTDPLESKLDPVFGAYGSKGPYSNDDDKDGEPARLDHDLTELQVLDRLKSHTRLARKYMQHAVLADWQESERAFHSQHAATSKYNRTSFDNRSKYFKPKTRVAVRKHQTGAAAALHSTRDVINTSANNAANKNERANAALLGAIINERFNNKTMKSGVPWFQVSMGARQNASIMGVCYSKQSWTLRVREREVEEDIESPLLNPLSGETMFDDDGEPIIQIETETTTFKDVIIDKPVIDLLSAENVLIDPSTSWINPVQDSPTLVLSMPMQYEDVLMLMDDNNHSLVEWRDVTREEITEAMYEERELLGLTAAREGTNVSRKDNSGRDTGTHQDTNSGMVLDVRECFYRIGEDDWHCYTLGDKTLLSEPALVEEIYPWARGARPVVGGTDVIDPEVLYPMSHVKSWSEAQNEINEIANLRMDATKQSIFPKTKVRAGAKVDYQAVQRMGGIVLVRDQDDVTWDRAPGPNPAGYQEANLLNLDFDDMAGNFSASSVQSNRSLNETVGGMQMISANAGATSEYDLRVWISTWVEPVLSQIVMLEQYYEADENLLAIAGEKAKLFQRYGVDQITDELLESQISISINVGIGSSDPIQQLGKFKSAVEMAAPFYQMAKADGAQMHYDEIFNEIFGKAGYRDGGERFISMPDKSEKTVPATEVDKMKKQMQKMAQEMEKLKSGEMAKVEIHKATLADKDKDRQNKIQIEQMKAESATDQNAANLMSSIRTQEMTLNAKLDEMDKKRSIELDKIEVKTEADTITREDNQAHDIEMQQLKRDESLDNTLLQGDIDKENAEITAKNQKRE